MGMCKIVKMVKITVSVHLFVQLVPSCPVRWRSYGQKTEKEPDTLRTRNRTPYGHPTDKEPDTTDKEPDTTDILRTNADMKEHTPGNFWNLICDSLAYC